MIHSPINNYQMQKVTIKQGGIYFSFWDQEQEDWVDKNITEGSLPFTWYMKYPIQIEEGLTVRKIIKMVEPYADILNIVMIHDLSAMDFEKILELNRESKSQSSSIEPNAVYLVRIAESIPTVQDEDEFNFLNSYPVIVGVKELDETGENDEVFSLSTIDFLDWCDLPFEIDDYVEYLNPQTEEVQFEGVMNWTLGELVSTVLGQAAITIQIMQNSVSPTAQTDGPVEIFAVFNWIEDLDKILLR